MIKMEIKAADIVGLAYPKGHATKINKINREKGLMYAKYRLKQ